jgi:hypothetical protein
LWRGRALLRRGLRRGGGLWRWRRGDGGLTRRGGCGGGLLFGGLGRRGRLVALADVGDDLVDLDRVALFEEDLRESPGRRAGNLCVDLVGRNLEERLVAVDVLADLLQPPRNRPLRDGLAHLRHHHFGCHKISSFQFLVFSFQF